MSLIHCAPTEVVIFQQRIVQWYDAGIYETSRHTLIEQHWIALIQWSVATYDSYTINMDYYGFVIPFYSSFFKCMIIVALQGQYNNYIKEYLNW